MQSVDTVIIGSGVGGLTAALLLASQPDRSEILVLESDAEFGGKISAGSDSEGVEWDMGPSVLTLPETLDGVFRKSGTSLQNEIELLKPDPFIRYRFPDGVCLDLNQGLGDATQSVRNVLGQKAENEWNRFLKASQKIWEVAAPRFIYGEAPRLTGVLKMGPAAWMDLMKIGAHRTMKSMIDAEVSDPHLRKIFARYATYNGSDYRRAPSTLNSIAWVELGLGGYGVKGGMSQIARALKARAESKGVTFQNQAQVQEILVNSSGHVTGVIVRSGQEIRCRSIVANADARVIYGEMVPLKYRSSPAPIEESSLSGWVGVFRVRGSHPAHSVSFSSDYEREWSELFDQRVEPTDPTLYFCDQMSAHQRIGWKGSDDRILFVMANAPSFLKRSDLKQRVIQRLQALKVIEADTPLLQERTPIQWARRFPGTGGAIYGMSSNRAQSAFQRAQNRDPKIRGLYLCGGSAHPGGGVPLCVLSGVQAAKHLLSEGK